MPPGHGRDPGTGLVIAGFGRRGEQWAQTVSRDRRFRVIGVVDPDPAAAARAAERGLRCWPAIAEAVAGGAEAVIVASPPDQHAPDALAAVAAGAGALVEKPLALSVADGMRIAEGARAAGRPVLVGMNFRLRPVERAIRTGLGRIGDPRTSLIHVTRPPENRSGGDAPGTEALWDVGIHHLDLLVDRAGVLPAAVTADAVTRSRPPGTAVQRVRLEWSSGAVADWILDDGGSVYHTHQWVEAAAGGLAADGDRVSVVAPDRRPRRMRLPRRPAAEAQLLSHLFAALEG